MSIDKECPICYDIIGVNNCCTTECGHSFCLKCILSATQNNHRCPFCRSEILELKSHSEYDDPADFEDDTEEEDNDEENENTIYKVDVSKLAKIYREKNYTFEDLLAIIVEFKFYSIDNEDGKYIQEYFDQFHNEIEEIIEIDLQERSEYEKELVLMRTEDVRFE
jgi:hypothetical protein